MPEELTPEDQLCLLLARGRFSPEIARLAIGRLETGPKWDKLVQRSRAHGLLPLLYHRLCALDLPGVPPPVRRQLTDTFGVNAIRNELLTQELVRVLAQLGAAGVPVIPLKGIALAESLYGDPALRTCSDLDVLIHPKYLAESLQLLRSSGYSDRFDRPSLIRLLARYGKDCGMMRQDGRSVYPLQVHCGLIWGGPAERRLLTDVWSDATPQPFHGAPAYAMSPEWEFLYLAVHAARHRMFPFKWLVDIDWLVARGNLDWEKVREKARWMGWERIVQSCLAACAALLQTPPPEPLARTAPFTPARIRASEPGPLQIPLETLFSLRLLPTLAGRFQFLAIRLFVPTPADCEFLRLPSSLFFLYYFFRPWRLGCAVAEWFIEAGVARLRLLRRRRLGAGFLPG